jgi:hypothetical protein
MIPQPTPLFSHWSIPLIIKKLSVFSGTTRMQERKSSTIENCFRIKAGVDLQNDLGEEFDLNKFLELSN